MANEQTPVTVSDLRRDPDRLLTQAELCALLNKSPAWAERHRWAKTGPRFVKIGRTPKYRAGDVLAYIEQRTVETDAA